MQKFVDAFIKSIETKNPDSLPMAARYKATENGIPGALCHMQAYRIIDKVNCIGTTALDSVANSAYVALNVAEGDHEVILSARLTTADDKITELELTFYRSRCDTGFWFAADEMEGLKSMWDKVIPAEQRASRSELDRLAHVVFDNTMDASMYGRDDGCYLMEAGGLVLENPGYSRLINPHIDDVPEDENTRVPMPFGVAPHRPMGADIRVLALDEERGILVVCAYVDGIVSPYLVSDETSTCFVPLPMIETHRRSLLPEFFEGKYVFEEMRATGETVTIVKYFDGKMYRLLQNISMKPYGSRSTWRSEVASV